MSFFCQLLSQTLQYWHIASVAQEPWQEICILPGSVAKNKNNPAWKSSRTQMVSRILRKISRCLACIDVHIHRLLDFDMLIRELCPIIVRSKENWKDWKLFRLLVESKRSNESTRSIYWHIHLYLLTQNPYHPAQMWHSCHELSYNWQSINYSPNSSFLGPFATLNS